MRKLLIVFGLGFFTAFCYSQTDVVSYESQNAYIEKGDYYSSKKDYKKAIVYYNMAYSKNSSYDALLKKADAYMALKLYDQAAECYRIVFKSDYKVPSEYMLKYALLLLDNKDISGYENWLSKYNKEVYGEIYDYTSGTEVRKRLYIDTTLIFVENENVLNSYESEICPFIYKDKVLFSSTRKHVSGNQSNDEYTVYSALRLNSGQLGKLNVFNKSMNSEQNESSVFISENTKKMYFTRNTSTNREFLKTYVTTIPANLNENLNIKEFTIDGFDNIGHISFNSDGTKMYFVSDSPEGNGGLDIYSSELVNNKWGTPENLGNKINTSSDDMYPCVLNDTMLYFTSGGHKGLGGLDLYCVNLNKENSAPENLGSKVNSTSDDFGLTFSPEGLTGYFSSNRPGGFGREDIYRLHLLNLKIKNPALQPKKRYQAPRKIALYLSDGEEYDIASKGNAGFSFSLTPQEPYKMVIRHENTLVTDVFNNEQLTETQREKAFLNPTPLEKTSIPLQSGMKYQFTVGMNPISNEYLNELNDVSKDYQNNDAEVIDLTALAKELVLTGDEVYTIQFVKDVNQPSIENKNKEVTTLAVNDQDVPLAGRSFSIILPLDIEVNFNMFTDLGHFKETFNPKKVGKVKIDTAQVQKPKPTIEAGFPLLVNTESLSEAPEKIFAKNLSVIPGTFYLLSLTKSFPGTDQKLEVFVPLTKSVRYKFGSNAVNEKEYNNELSKMLKEQSGTLTDEERIDISILSKELDISSEDSVVFSLMPVERKGKQASEARNVNTVLEIDGRKYSINREKKMQIILTLDENNKANIQTDLAYVKENFEPSTIALKIDNTAISDDIKEESKKIITDPVFDVVVVKFNLNEYAIREDAQSILEDKVIHVLNGDSRLYVTIKGYTDPLGNAAYNEKLSENRAQAVKDFLVSNGIGDSRIRTFSFGEIVDIEEGVSWEDLSEEQLQEYRKVEIVIYLPK